jgi:RNA polymerase sigma factor (sigma-70 family)
LWLVLCHLRQSSAISGAIVRWLRSIIRPICVSLGSGLRVRRGDLPEDVEQEVLVYFEERVFQERRWPNDPEAYLSKVARRVVARLRRQSARVLDLVTGTDLAEVLAQAHTRSADIAAQINAAVLAEQFGSQLTSRQRAVFVLRWIGFSDTEIAKRLQLSRRRVCEIGKQIVRRLGPVWTASSL